MDSPFYRLVYQWQGETHARAELLPETRLAELNRRAVALIYHTADATEDDFRRLWSEIEGGPAADEWSKPDTRAVWARRFGFSVNTFDRRRKDGTIRWRRFGRLIQIHRSSLPPKAE